MNIELRKDNYTAFKLYMLVANQVIVAPMGEVIGLDINAVINVMKIMNVDEEDKEELLQTVQNIWRTLYDKQKAKEKNKKNNVKNKVNIKNKKRKFK